MYINVGCPGRCNDSGIFERSTLKKKLLDRKFKEQSISVGGIEIPVVILGDSAFRLTEFLMKPYPFHISATESEKKFNYALSKCRRVVENAFGHLKARFRRIGKGLDNSLKNVNIIIKCCCVLHNFLNEQNEKINERWIQVQNMYEESNNKPQPNVEEYVYDANRRGDEIRTVISILLNEI